MHSHSCDSVSLCIYYTVYVHVCMHEVEDKTRTEDSHSNEQITRKDRKVFITMGQLMPILPNLGQDP